MLQIHGVAWPRHAHRTHHHLTDGTAWDAHLFSGAGFPEDFFFLLQELSQPLGKSEGAVDLLDFSWLNSSQNLAKRKKKREKWHSCHERIAHFLTTWAQVTVQLRNRMMMANASVRTFWSYAVVCQCPAWPIACWGFSWPTRRKTWHVCSSTDMFIGGCMMIQRRLK